MRPVDRGLPVHRGFAAVEAAPPPAIEAPPLPSTVVLPAGRAAQRNTFSHRVLCAFAGHAIAVAAVLMGAAPATVSAAESNPPSAAAVVDPSPSELSRLLDAVDAGRAGRAQVEQAALRGGALSRARPREAQRAIEYLAKGPTSSRSERAIVAILGALAPEDRGQVLRLIDGGADPYTVAKITGDDIDEPDFRAEALRLVKEASPYRNTAEPIVVSDLDDTIKPRVHPTFRGAAFPGARELFRALDAGFDGRGVPGDVHVVTARLDGAERDLRRAGVDHGSVAYGELGGGIGLAFGDHGGVEREKVRDILGLLSRNPDSQAVLFGDNVQADPKVFLRILAAKPERVALALIHEVPGHSTPAEFRAHPNCVVFRDYGEAAKALFARGMISSEQYVEVVRASRDR